MTEYPIKRGYFKDLEEKGITNIMKEAFGNVKEANGIYSSNYGEIKNVSVEIKGKTKININLDMNKDADAAIAEDTRKVWNNFLLNATGYTSKERAKKLKDMAKKGKL